VTVRRAFPLFLLTAAAILAACQRAAPLSAADQLALRALDDSFAARAVRKDFRALAAQYAVDAHFMPPNARTVVGRDAILTWMIAYPPMTEFKLMPDEIGGTGDLAYVRGRYAIVVIPPGAKVAVADTGKYLEVSRRQADGTWLMIADIFNSDKAAMP
jgi:ketosteroid isomerase-like protein